MYEYDYDKNVFHIFCCVEDSYVSPERSLNYFKEESRTIIRIYFLPTRKQNLNILWNVLTASFKVGATSWDNFVAVIFGFTLNYFYTILSNSLVLVARIKKVLFTHYV